MQAEEMYPCQRAPVPRAAPRLAGDDEAAATGTCNTRARSCGSRSTDRLPHDLARVLHVPVAAASSSPARRGAARGTGARWHGYISSACMQHRSFLYCSLALVAPACASEHGAFVNQMAHTATPYLSRAARQPVSWQPWSREVFALAARLDRPVLLYVGAEDCRWCTAMDREVYSDPDLGAMIDSLFVPVRVDRDERPDVAQRYQSAVLSLAGLRGYPLTVFLTPDGSPFFGGTYFPADDPVTGRGLKQLLPDVARDFHDRRDVLVQHAAVVRQLALSRALGAHGVLRPQALAAEVEAVRGSLASAVASGHALTGVASTQAVALRVTEYIRSGDTAALRVARTALDAMLDTEVVSAATGDEPREIVRASLARALSLAWVATAEPRY